jgi:hypothetical protein
MAMVPCTPALLPDPAIFQLLRGSLAKTNKLSPMSCIETPGVEIYNPDCKLFATRYRATCANLVLTVHLT